MGGPAAPSSPLLSVLTVLRLREVAGSEELRLLRTLRRPPPPPPVLETSSLTTERLLSSAWTGLELDLVGKFENILPGRSSWGRPLARERLNTLSTNTFIFILGVATHQSVGEQ